MGKRRDSGLAVLEGLAAFGIAAVAGLLLSQITVQATGAGWESLLTQRPGYVYAVAVAAVAVVVAPMLARLTGSAGRWAVAALGTVTGVTAVIAAPPTPDLFEMLVFGGFGLALGGVLVAMAGGGGRSRGAIAVGLSAGLILAWWVLALAETAGGALAEVGWVVGVTGLVIVVSVLVAVLERPSAAPAAPAAPAEPAEPPEPVSRWLPKLAGPGLAVAATAGAVVMLEAARRTLVAGWFDTGSVPQVARLDTAVRIATVAGLAAALLWCAHWYARRLGPGSAGWPALGRLVLVAAGASVPLLVGLEAAFWREEAFAQPRPVGSWLLALVVLAAAAAGVGLGQPRRGWRSGPAGRANVPVVPWDAVGLALCAGGLWLLVSWPASGLVPYYLLGAGFGLALGAALAAAVAAAPTAGGLAIGAAGLLLATTPLAPVAWWARFEGDGISHGGRLTGPAVVLMAAAVLAAWWWFGQRRAAVAGAGADAGRVSPVPGGP